MALENLVLCYGEVNSLIPWDDSDLLGSSSTRVGVIGGQAGQRKSHDSVGVPVDAVGI